MIRDPLEERSAELFAAARKEFPAEETRRKIALALRARPEPKDVSHSWLGEHKMPVFFALAAASVGAFVGLRPAPENVEISAERLSLQRSPEAAKATEAPVEAASDQRNASPQNPVQKDRHRTLTDPQRIQEQPAPPTLAQELSGIQSARAFLTAGDAAAALAQLDRFQRDSGFQQLKVEAQLLRIEALSQVGRTEEARAQALRFVEENRNNPLVDRAAKFTRNPASPEVAGSVKSESE
jgi:hypothetical protein